MHGPLLIARLIEWSHGAKNIILFKDVQDAKFK